MLNLKVCFEQIKRAAHLYENYQYRKMGRTSIFRFKIQSVAEKEVDKTKNENFLWVNINLGV